MQLFSTNLETPLITYCKKIFCNRDFCSAFYEITNIKHFITYKLWQKKMLKHFCSYALTLIFPTLAVVVTENH